MTNVGNGRQLPGHPVSGYVDIPIGEAGGWDSRGSTHRRISIVAYNLQVCLQNYGKPFKHDSCPFPTCS